jgi:hypothetical protein
MSDCRVRVSMHVIRFAGHSGQTVSRMLPPGDALTTHASRGPEPSRNKLACVSSPWRVDIPHNPTGLHVSRMCVISTRQIYSVILGSTICALCSSYCPLALHYKLVVKIFF